MYYDTGKPCKHGHGTLRYIKGNACVECQKLGSAKRWRAGVKHSKYDFAYSRNKQLIKKYGITSADYEGMFAAQEGKCAVCGGPPTNCGRGTSRLHVDHDHATGAIRGLLCYKCNIGLGSFHDDPTRLELAAGYLRAFGRY